MNELSLQDIMKKWFYENMSHFSVIRDGEIVCDCIRGKNMGWVGDRNNSDVIIWNTSLTNMDTENPPFNSFNPADPLFFQKLKSAIIVWHERARKFEHARGKQHEELISNGGVIGDRNPSPTDKDFPNIPWKK